MEAAIQQLKRAFIADEHSTVARLLDEHPQLREFLNQPLSDGQAPALGAVKSCGMADVLISRGADVTKVAEWWAPGFGVQQIEPAIARHLIDRGAAISIHAAVGIGLVDVVREMLERDPSLVHKKGGDGCRPLHFCTNIEIAALLLERNAEVNARDDDHNSTPAQWRVSDAPAVVRLLLERGATADIFMAAGLGNLPLAKELVAEQPECTSYRIGNNHGPFPGIGFHGAGGTIYQWSLGFNLSPHEVALKLGHTPLYEFLLEHTSPRAKFLVACTTANRPLAEAVVAQCPNVVSQLDDEDRALLPKYCWETNNNIEAVRLMLDMGFPIDAKEHNHGYSPLHNAAWCGDLELVELLLERGHATDIYDPQYHSSPLGFALHSCLEAKRHPDGKFPQVIDRLLTHGSPIDGQHFPVGDAEIDAVIERHLKARNPSNDNRAS